MRDMTCPEVSDSAPGFALDILDPATRAQVAAHLIRCDGCREAVTSMQCSAAELLDLPEPGEWAPPPRRSVGDPTPDGVPAEWWPTDWSPDDLVEGGWPDRSHAVRTRRRRFRTVVTMAAAALLLVGSTFGPELEQLASHPEMPTTTAALMSAGVPVGSVRLFTGKVQAVDVSVRHLPESGSMDLIVVDRTGVATQVGRMDVARGLGAWLGHPPVSLTELTDLVVVDSARHQVAAAALGS